MLNHTELIYVTGIFRIKFIPHNILQEIFFGSAPPVMFKYIPRVYFHFITHYHSPLRQQ